MKNNKTINEIIEILEKGADSEISFLIPFDFSFLVRGGRVNGLVGGVGALLKLIPVMSKTDDGKRLEKYSIARTMKKAVADVIEGLKKKGCDGTYHFFVSHAFNDEVADKFIEAIKNEFDTDNIKKLLLSPAFITQGGPKCVAIQAIKLYKNGADKGSRTLTTTLGRLGSAVKLYLHLKIMIALKKELAFFLILNINLILVKAKHFVFEE